MDSIFIEGKYQPSWALRFLHYKMCLSHKFLSDDQMKSVTSHENDIDTKIRS